jgi:hypothetical protein
LVSVTVTVKLCVALRLGVPLSETRNVMVFVLGPCASVGVHVSTPLAGSRFTPLGADTNAKVKVWAGTSLSVAVLVTVNIASSASV